jgi:hypothetical protein
VRFWIRAIADRDLRQGTTVANAVAFIPFLVFAGHLFLDAPDGERTSWERRAERITADDGFALALWTISLEEWTFTRRTFLAAALRCAHLNAESDDASLFEKARPILRQCAWADRIQSRLKGPSGIAPVVTDGALVVQSHAGATWIVQFLADWESGNAFRMCAEWKAMAEEVDAELNAADNAETALAATGEKLSEPAIDWIRKQLVS